MSTIDSLSIDVGVTGDASDALSQLIELVQQLVSAQADLLTAGRGTNVILDGQGQASEDAARGLHQVTDEAGKQKDALGLLRDYWKQIAALGIGAMIKGQLDSVRDQAVGLKQASVELGVTTRGFQALHFAAEQSTVPISAVDSALGSLQDTIRGAAMGNSDQMQSLGFLGLNGRALSKMDAPGRFAAVADALNKIGDPTRRAGVAMRVFGGSAQQMLPLLAKGSDGIQELTNQFADLGGGLSDDQIDALVEWDHALSRTGVSLTRFRGLLAQTVLPVLKVISGAFGTIVDWLQKFDQKAHAMEFGGLAVLTLGFWKLFKVIKSVGDIDLWKGALSTAKWLGILLIIAAVAAVVQDLIHGFRGGRSVIFEVVDKLLGLGKVDGWVRNIKAGWESMSKLEFPGIQDVLDSFISFYRGDELKGKIEATKDSLKSWNEEAAKVKDPTERAMYGRRRDQLQSELDAYENQYFGVRGLRTVGRGVASDAQRSGEMTTGSLSRFEGGVGSVTVQNQIKVEAAPGMTGTAQAAKQGVQEAFNKSARDLQAISGGRRK